MAAQTPKTADIVEATQPIIDLARDDHEGGKVRKGGGGDEAGKDAKSAQEEEEEADGRDGSVGDAWEEGEVERGMLHALVELGNLEMLIHQVRGCLFSSLSYFLFRTELY